MPPANRRSIKWEIFGVILCLVLVSMATGLPCPEGTTYYPQGGLCYWEITMQVPFQAAHALCNSSQGGGLALVPFPHTEPFLVDKFTLGNYPPANGSTCICSTWWVGYWVDSTVALVSSTYGDLPASWLPSLNTMSFQTGMCARVLQNTTTPIPSFQWLVQDCDVQRRSLCSRWAGSRSATWRAEPGRLVSHIRATMTVSTVLRCATSCRLQDGCASINFRKSTGTCELCSKVKDYPGVSITSDPEFKHYEITA